MAKVRIHVVWHSITGEIVAVGRPMGAAKCIPLSGENQSVIETEIEEGQFARLYETHRVDAGQKALAKLSNRKK
jgi:hypothetical protein